MSMARVRCLLKSNYGTLGGTSVYYYEQDEVREVGDMLFTNLYTKGSSEAAMSDIPLIAVEIVPSHMVESGYNGDRFVGGHKIYGNQ
jgi:hypothetical protein